MLSVITIGFVAAYLLAPLVSYLEKRGLPRLAAILFVYLFLLLIFTASIIIILPYLFDKINEFAKRLPDILMDFKKITDDFFRRFEDNVLVMSFKSSAESKATQLQAYFQDMVDDVGNGIISTVGVVANFLVGLTIAFYVLKDIKLLRIAVKNFIPRKWRGLFCEVWREINKIISSFLRVRLSIAFLLMLVSIIALLALRVKFAVVLGIISGISELIPFFGPILGAIPAVLVAALDSPSKAILVVITFTALQQIEGNIISPKMMGDELGVHPIVALIFIYLGGKHFGLTGMFFAVPLAAILKVICLRAINSFIT